MNDLAYTVQGAPYSLVPDLGEPTSMPPTRHLSPDEMPWDELLLKKLGVNGWGRVQHFRNCYASGWGENNLVLSPKAMDALCRFMEFVNFPAKMPAPSIFLTDRGGVELCWEDMEGKAVQVEFTSTAVEYYQAASDQEGSVSFAELKELSRRLSA